MTEPESLADIGELGLIARVVCALRAPASPAGPGDDAAVVAAPDGRVVATTDVLVQDVHFRLDWSDPADIGAKAAAANLADLAAMGATASALLVGLVAPAQTPVRVAEGIAAGLAEEAAAAGAVVVGGDTAAGPCLVLAVTALGDLQGRAPVLRSGASAGDVLVVVGALGRSAAGLRLLETGPPVPPAPRGPLDAELVAALARAHRRPRPPYAGGPELARAGATAMCDVSDGLLADAAHLARASGVDVEIDRLVLPAGVRVEEVLTGGEDHALLATLPPGSDLPAGARRIGRVVAGPGRVRLTGGLASLADRLGDRVGFRHFGPAEPASRRQGPAGSSGPAGPRPPALA